MPQQHGEINLVTLYASWTLIPHHPYISFQLLILMLRPDLQMSTTTLVRPTRNQYIIASTSHPMYISTTIPLSIEVVSKLPITLDPQSKMLLQAVS